MERALRTVASSFVLLCSAALATPTGGQDAPMLDSLCEPGVIEHLILDEPQRRHCQEVLRSRIREMQQRSREHVRRVIEENRIRREYAGLLPTLPRPPVTVESFIGRDELARGDIVVTEQGPRVYVGQPGEPARAEDFVALDSTRSPYRGRAGVYDGAYPQPRARQTTLPAPQERAP